jgi:hypothetical protein
MMQVGASIAISALATLSLTVFRNRLHADPDALHQALAAGYTSGLKVGARTRDQRVISTAAFGFG